MKSEFVRVHPDIKKAIMKVSKNLNIPASNASVIVFYGLEKKNVWDHTLSEALIFQVRRNAKHKIAMTL
jgi:hypothetical protein